MFDTACTKYGDFRHFRDGALSSLIEEKGRDTERKEEKRKEKTGDKDRNE